MPHIVPYSLVPWLRANWRRFTVATHALCPLVSAGLRLAATPLADLCGPAGTLLLRAARERQRIGRDVLGDDAARSDIGALADLDRRHQRRVRADKGAGADLGAMLVEAVIVAGDGAGADISARADAGVADISEMVNLGALADLGLLDLDEIADMGVRRRGSAPGLSRANGPTIAPAPICAPTIWQKPLMVAPSSMTTRSPITTWGSITTSLPICVSC